MAALAMDKRSVCGHREMVKHHWGFVRAVCVRPGCAVLAHGTYANGVTFQSPGFAATPRTLGHDRHPHWLTPTGLDKSLDVHGRVGDGQTIGMRAS